MPIHWLHLYQKPAQGNDFLKRCACLNYRHRISAFGWFDTASCNLAVTVEEGERMLEQMLGNRVAVFVDNPIEPIWEGYISRLTFEYGPVVYTIGLDEMANQVTTVWNKPNASPPQQVTSTANNTDSQAIYGIKAISLDLNVNYTTDGAGRYPRVARDTELALRAWPPPSAAFRAGTGAQPLLRVEMRGFYTTLDWSLYNEPTSSELTLTQIIQLAISLNANADTFFDHGDWTKIDTNGVIMDWQNESSLGRWQFCKQVVEAGDDATVSVRRWLIGIGATDPNSGTRRFYYRRANPTVAYTARLRDVLGAIRNNFGRPVDPWRMTPDAALRIVDSLPGWQGEGDDPRVIYVESVDYDGERGLVSFASSDDISLEGVFRLRSMNKPTNLRFGIVRSAY